MPVTSPEEKRIQNIENQRRWRKRHPQKLKAYKKHYKENHIEQLKLSSARYRHKQKRILEEIFGMKCFTCGKESKRMIYHEINGKRHQSNRSYILTHINDFVALCSSCHHLLHFIKRKQLAMPKIEELAKRMV